MTLTGTTLRVLLVEDNPADADLIREALDEADLAALGGSAFELVHVRRLADGEALLARGDIAVVLLDLSLPDSQGLETFVRVGERAPGTPIVVLSGLQDEALAVRAVREGAQDYLVKGQVDGVTLMRSLRYAIERSRAEEERARLLREQTESEAALRARDEVLATVSHDLKNPLATIKGIAQLLARRVASGQTPEPEVLVERLDQIARTATQMGVLLDDLLDVTRLRAGRALDLQRVPTDLVALVQRLVGECQRDTGRHVLEVVSDEPELVALVDEVRLERVFRNLIDNAIKYSPDGGTVTVTLARTEDGHGRPWASVAVRDPGIGIPAADLPRLFERFYRASNVVGQIRGSGIGLAGARQIVEQHDGSITAESEQGRGSTFTVRLPLDASPDAAAD